mmetsp:Transcript_25143/g.65901  ORF Transcript_25143/g.65901 Transcript_25143/m.65901 type:complete len:240 (-) Transcript_25143:675-1394(-)
MLEEYFAIEDNLDSARGWNEEGVWMGSVFLRLLSHQTHVGAAAHRARVKSTVLFAEIDGLTKDTGVAPVWDAGLEVLLLVVGIPHLSSNADGSGHGIVDDDVARHMKISDSSVAVHHGHSRAFLVHRINVCQDRSAFRFSTSRNLGVHVADAIVWVDTQFVEGRCMFFEDFPVIHTHAVSEHDGVRHLHHRGLQMEREENTPGLGIFDFPRVVLLQATCTHEGSIQHVTCLQSNLLLED